MSNRKVLVALLLLLPAAARPNGGGSITVTPTGAIAGASGGPLERTELISIPEIECVSEALSIQLGPAAVWVRVEYVLKNHGEARTIDYAFPFAIGEAPGESGKGTVRLGEPISYALAVDGAPVRSEVRPGAPIAPGIAVPTLGDAGWRSGGARYGWSYRVSRVEFPAGKTRKLTVRYSTPYLVYTRVETGDGESRATGRESFSYILSTGGGWKDGTIGKLSIRVTSDGAPADLWLEGVPFRREQKGWSFEASGFRPTLETNVLVRRPLWEEVDLSAEHGRGFDFERVSPTHAGEMVLRGATERDPYEKRRRGRYRLALAFEPDPLLAQPAWVRVTLGLGEEPPEVFHARFQRATEGALNEEGWQREIRFEAPVPPETIRITFLDVIPGKGGTRRLKVHSARLRTDVGNYDWQ